MASSDNLEEAARAASVCSLRSSGGGAADREALDATEEFLDDPFALAVDQLYEKRTSTREQGLQTLTRLLAADVQFEECGLRVATFTQVGAGAQQLGCRAVAGLAKAQMPRVQH